MFVACFSLPVKYEKHLTLKNLLKDKQSKNSKQNTAFDATDLATQIQPITEDAI